MKSQNGSTDNHPAGSDAGARGGTGHIVLRLATGVGHDSHDLGEVAQQESLGRVRAFLERNPQLATERLIRHAGPELIRTKEAAASRHGFVPLETLTAYWRLDVREQGDAERLRRELAGMEGEIAVAYHESSVSEANGPVLTAVANPYFKDQGFLNAAPQGIGVRDAWGRIGGKGGEVRVIDLEAGWILAHQDLPKPQLLYGDDGVAHGYVSGDHGAAAMGVIGALNNQIGVIGVAPEALVLNAVSHYDAAKNAGMHVADAIGAALQHLQAGDVLLLEVQRTQDGKVLPTEIDSADFHAIRLASAHGIIVIEAAGNGEQNLDAWIDPQGEHCLEVGAPGYRDSGAILVGSSKAAVMPGAGGVSGHKRYYTSNYGSRVNVYAWGERIYTTGYGSAAGAPGAVDSYASNFGQTSGASAVIAGAAALVQSWHKSRNGTPLSAADMRTLLSSASTGTPQVLLSNDPIGVMPNLAAIIK